MSAVRGKRFVEVGDRVFVGRYREWDTTVGVVVGDGGTLVVDTRASAGQGAALRDDVRRLAPDAEIRWVVNTHQHFDHTFGNIAFAAATIYAHENAAAGLMPSGDRIKAQIGPDPVDDVDEPWQTAALLQEVASTQYRLPDVTFSSTTAIDLGDRYVELAHPGRGHTDGDIVIGVSDAGVLFAGDLIEESGPPMFGVDAFPLEWPGALDLVIGMLSDGAVVVPGHGAPVDRQFVQDQRSELSDVAALIRALHGQGVPPDQALSDPGTSWPFPPELLTNAVHRGYLHAAAPPPAWG